MTIRNRELSQFGSFIYIQNDTKDIGITTEATPYVGIGTTNATAKFHVFGQTKLEGDVEITGVSTFQGNVNLGDGDRLRFGDGNDLQIYHDGGGSGSIIEHDGGGSLYVRANGTSEDLYLRAGRNINIQPSGGEDGIRLLLNGAVELYHDDVKKFETTGVGVTIYDTLNVGTGVTIFGSSGIISATTINAELDGNAGTATSLVTARDFSITGDFVTASVISFDGTGNVALAATITADSIELGTYTAGDYIESTSGITSEIVVTGGTGEGSTPTIGLSPNLVLPGNLEVNGISTFTNETSFTGITTFTNQLFTTDINNSGIVSATAFYQNGVLIVDAALEVWEPISGNNIYRELGNVGIGTSTNLKKLSVNGQIESQATQGTAPFVVNSTTTVPNLSADLLDGKSAPTGDIVGTTDTQTLTNKTLTTPIITSISNSGTQTVPTGTGTLVSTNSVGVITTGMIGDLEITNDDVSNSAAIAYSKLNLTGSIVDGDISTGTIANDKLANSTISGISLGSNLNDLSKGDFITYSSGTTYNGGTAITIGVAGTTINTGDTLVARDSSGDFTAGTATLYGVTLNGGSVSGSGNINIDGNITAGTGYTFYGDGSGITGITADVAVQVSTADTSTAGPFYLTFVDSNNTPASYESLFTDGGIVYDALNVRLGVGTDNPSHELDIESVSPTIELKDSDNNYKFQLTQSGSATYVDFDTDGGGGSSLRIRNAYDEKIRISSTGSVGIGTDDPAVKLDVLDNDIQIFVGDISEGATTTDGGVRFNGIGTTIQSAAFTEVNGEILSYGINISQITAGYSTDRVGGIFRFDTRTGGNFGNSDNFVIKGRSIGTTVEHNSLVINLDTGETSLSPVKGNVGIGTNNPSAKLDVNGTLNVSGVSTFQDDIYLPDHTELRLGDSDELKILHRSNGDSSITESGSGALYIGGNRIRIADGYSSNLMAEFDTSSVDLYYNHTKKFETTADGILVKPNVGLGTTAGNADASQDLASFETTVNNTSKLRIIEERDVNGTDWTTAYTRIQKTIDVTDMGYIQFNGSGNNYGIEFGTQGDEKFAQFIRNGAVELYYDNSKKFETTSGGVNITGIVTATGGFNIGIQSAGVEQTTGVVTAINFIGAGNTFAYNAGTKTIDVSIEGGGGGGGGATLDITASLFV